MRYEAMSWEQPVLLARLSGPSRDTFQGEVFSEPPEKLWKRVGAGVESGGVEALVAARRWAFPGKWDKDAHQGHGGRPQGPTPLPAATPAPTRWPPASQVF